MLPPGSAGVSTVLFSPHLQSPAQDLACSRRKVCTEVVKTARQHGLGGGGDTLPEKATLKTHDRSSQVRPLSYLVLTTGPQEVLSAFLFLRPTEALC